MHDELRDALRRVEPPEGFADRVLQKAARDAQPRLMPSRFRAPARFAIAATLVLVIGGGLWYRAEERRREGEEAKRQVLLSLSLAGNKLQEIEMKVNRRDR